MGNCGRPRDNPAASHIKRFYADEDVGRAEAVMRSVRQDIDEGFVDIRLTKAQARALARWRFPSQICVPYARILPVSHHAGPRLFRQVGDSTEQAVAVDLVRLLPRGDQGDHVERAADRLSSG